MKILKIIYFICISLTLFIIVYIIAYAYIFFKQIKTKIK